VILDHVAQRAGVVVVAAAAFDADRLGRRDLHAIDVAPVPDRFEDHVGEAQRHDVLHRLFAEIVVDAVDGFSSKTLLTSACSARAESRSVPNGFSMMMRVQPGCSFGPRPAASSMSTIVANTRRRRREIEEPVARVPSRASFCRVCLAQLRERGLVVERAAHVREPLGEIAPERILGRAAARELVDRLVHLVAKLLVRLGTREADDAEVRRQMSPSRRLYIAGISMRFDQVAARAEEDDVARVGDPARVDARAQRVGSRR
jgi:hypothetical protein